MNLQEKIREVTEIVNQICDFLQEGYIIPQVEPEVSEKIKFKKIYVMNIELFRSIKRDTLDVHPELKQIPWVIDYGVSLKRYMGVMKKFDEIGMSAEEIKLKKKFSIINRINGKLIHIYEMIVTGRRNPLTMLEKHLLEEMMNRVHSDLESMTFDMNTYNRWIDGIMNSRIQIISNIQSLKRL